MYSANKIGLGVRHDVDGLDEFVEGKGGLLEESEVEFAVITILI